MHVIIYFYQKFRRSWHVVWGETHKVYRHYPMGPSPFPGGGPQGNFITYWLVPYIYDDTFQLYITFYLTKGWISCIKQKRTGSLFCVYWCTPPTPAAVQPAATCLKDSISAGGSRLTWERCTFPVVHTIQRILEDFFKERWLRLTEIHQRSLYYISKFHARQQGLWVASLSEPLVEFSQNQFLNVIQWRRHVASPLGIILIFSGTTFLGPL